MVCMITYDLNKTGQNYEKVIQAIKDVSTGVWCTFWKSSYLIKTNLTPQQITDKIKPHLDSNDTLLVIEVKQNYQGWLEEDDWKYINESIFS